jgi:hypothetical protein
LKENVILFTNFTKRIVIIILSNYI